MDDAEIRERLAALEGWELRGSTITKAFDRGDFEGSVAFLNAITPAAEGMNHHPDVEISWKTVTISLTTHSEGGLTEGDFELAGKIDALA